MPPTIHVCKLTAAQAAELRDILAAENWELDDLQYAHWRARKNKTTAVAYESGKFCVQGKDTAEFIELILEPRVLKEVRYGYEDILARDEHPAMFQPHAGIDESGKGDYFGPLVIAAVYVDDESATKLLAAGIKDSKAIKSDGRIGKLAAEVRQVVGGRWSVVQIGPEAYNRLYKKMGNLNRMLAWGHARAIEDLLAKQPDCPRAISDQFGNRKLIENALMKNGRGIKLEQMPRAEADIAVAAASILARDGFVKGLQRLGTPLEIELPKGASDRVVQAGCEIAAKHGLEALGRVAKLHFRTTEKITEATPGAKA